MAIGSKTAPTVTTEPVAETPAPATAEPVAEATAPAPATAEATGDKPSADDILNMIRNRS